MNTHISNILLVSSTFLGTSPCADVIASFWSMQVKNQDIYIQQYCCFQPIKESFYNYPFISVHDRIPRTCLLSLTCLNMPADKIVPQTNFMVEFTSRSLPHLEEIPGCLIWHLLQVFVCHQLSTKCILSLQIQYDGRLCLLFPGLWSVEEGPFITLGMSEHLSTAASIPCDLHNSIRVLLSDQPKGLGGWGEISQ